MANKLRKMNTALYNASLHLFEAGKQLAEVEEFGPDAMRLFKMADDMLNIIQPEEEKVTEEQMLSILGEIMNFSSEKKNAK